MMRGWLPEIEGAGLPGLNGSGDAATVPPDSQINTSTVIQQ